MTTLLVRVAACLAAALLTACSGSSQMQSDPESLRKLKSVRGKRAELRKQIDALKPDIRQKCEMTDGDCLMFMRDQRQELTAGHFSVGCQSAVLADEREECLVEYLAQHGKAKEASEFYAYDNWCMSKLLQCSTKLTKNLASQAWEAELANRRMAFESSPQVAVAQQEAAIIQEKVKYLRSTLPPSADDVCKDLPAVDECSKQVEQKTQAFETELVKAAGQYDPVRAGELFEARNSTEAGCSQPELDCVLEKLGSYASTKQTRKLLDRNLELVVEHYLLGKKASPTLAEKCAAVGVAKHQGRIIEDYRAYVRQTTPYFRYQLNKSFLEMHRFQVDCLKRNTP